MPIKILLADDHALIRHGLRAVLLCDNNFEVIGDAVNGVVAVAKTAELEPDIVLMDIRMPLMDGCEATRQIKINNPNTKVLILTSNDSSLDMFAALAAGADGYCLKDTPVEELIQAIQTVHIGTPWLDPQIARLVLRSIGNGFPLPPGLGLNTNSTDHNLVGVKSAIGANTAQARKQNDGPPFGLSPREVEVLGLLVDGLSNTEIAKELVISSDTVKTHMKHIMGKLQVNDRTKAAIKAIREGIS